MTPDGRLTIRFPSPLAAYIEHAAATRGLTRQEVIRRALGLAQAFDMEVAGGRYVGAATARDALETIFVTPL